MKTHDASTRSRGFTLLEVLVAVAVLGLLYTTLAGVTIQGLRAEGESARRLEASLLIDQVLADLEVALHEGAAPPLGRQPEEEKDGFVIVTEVSGYQLPVKLEGPEGLEPGPSLFGVRGGEPLVRRIDVSVSWTEGGEEVEVRRTTFGLDLEGAAPLLEGLARQHESAGPANPDNDDGGAAEGSG